LRIERGELRVKKAVIILGSLLIVFSLVVGIPSFYKSLKTPSRGVPDQTGFSNINVMLTRPDNWEKIVDKAIISHKDMRVIDGSTATIPITAELLRQFYNYNDVSVNQSGYVYHSTTHNAYINLIDSKSAPKVEDDYIGDLENPVGIILVTPPSEEETRYAEEMGVELDMVPIAREGFVFITHKDNPVDSLTFEQIQDIYTGKITNWKKLGGEDVKIKAYQREPNSGSQTAMEQMVMKGRPMKSPIEVTVHYGMGELVEAVAKYENGKASIGYTYYYYINNLYKNENIKVLKINGVSPSNENLISGDYPFSTSYYAVIRGNEPEDSPARKLRDFLVSPLGQEVIAMAGYCRIEN